MKLSVLSCVNVRIKEKNPPEHGRLFSLGQASATVSPPPLLTL